ncbi:NFX1-type zinc finger-containing protein [Nesidiocoris tenuis]|uniref:NFX1-type zinc finger-containing protein n=1 Tax=Nesidiocoris tenuis TaxID=355587 RepID=A0ABN7ATR5_9HEMI|nr:NFX1-type zinc finger-containing protein [Nesidiocoris tenuis]
MDEEGWSVQGKHGKNADRSNSQSLVNRRGTAALTSLKRLADWDALISCGRAGAILDTMERLEATWLKDFEHLVDMNLTFGVLKTFSFLIREKTLGALELLKKTMTIDLIGKIAKHLKQAKTSHIDLTSSDGQKIVQFTIIFRENVMHLLCHDKGAGENYFIRQRLIEALDICLDLISFLYSSPSNEAELISLEMVCKFSTHSNLSKARMTYCVYPHNFQSPTEWTPIKEKGPYEDLEDYIDTHFCLLKEDFDSNLRDGVKSLLEKPNAKNQNIWAYRDVQLCQDPFITYNKCVYEIQFTNTRVFANVSWDTSKRFLHGSLLILSNDNFLTYYFATVESRIIQRNGIPRVQVCFVSIPRKFGDGNYLLIEPHVFFPPYFYTMMALHKMLTQGVPFERYIVYANTEKSLPSYLKKDSTYTIGTHTLKISDQEKWLTPSALGLNESQRNAFFSCLTNEVALIQGPPGTGKTFLALKVLESLIHNRKYGAGPILIVCYKNYALDQILERFVGPKINVLRIGGQSKNESLSKDKNLRNVRAFLPAEVVSAKRKWKAQVDSDFARLQELTVLLNLVRAQIGLVKLDIFKKFKVVGGDVTLDIVSWLLKDRLGSLCKNLKRFQGQCFALSLNELAQGAEMLKLRDGRVHPKDLKEFYRIGQILSVVQYYLTASSSLQSVNLSKVEVSNELNFHQRWMVYMTWQRKLVTVLEEERRLAQESLIESQKALQEVSDYTLYKIQGVNPDIIGLTTTAAARHYSALYALGAKIVMIEEAAEVLESHIIASISTKCQHLILIGDHQQLKPSVKSNELNTVGKMEVSLFERLINNKIEWLRLSTQHRMRPEISALICPLIYKDLEDAPSTKNHPHIRGMEKDVFFFSHSQQEQHEVDGESKFNKFEAQMIAGTVHYLLCQGYDPNSITVLSAYGAQASVIHKALFKTYMSEEYKETVKDVTISTVDNYQGQENNIVLLSLVRSNVNGDIGFLKLANRICVGLSRAKDGLFIFGNMPCLSKPPGSAWKQLRRILESQKALGTSLPLKCATHETVTLVSDPQDFQAVPYGGCGKVCAVELNCGHNCKNLCHGFDRGHTDQFICKQDCLLKCSRGHGCSSTCNEPCPPCSVLVLRKLKCNHVQKIQCYLGDDRIHCNYKLAIELERCGHENTVRCGFLFEHGESILRCNQKLVATLNCGHKLRYKCGTISEEDILNVACLEKCNRININCPEGHECDKKCSDPCGKCDHVVKKKLNCGHSMMVKCCESVDDVACHSPCSRQLPCRHICRNLCSQPCYCKEMVPRRVKACGHVIKVECHTPDELLPDLCEEPCEKHLSCGHPCPGTCRQICDALECLTKVKFTLPCGHPVMVHCKLLQPGGLKINDLPPCKYPCRKGLPCGHLCRGTCGTCYEGRLHQPCLQRCDAVLECKHNCRNRCSLLYHSCTNRKCVDICHKKELKAREEHLKTIGEHWHKNQNIMDKINLELRQQLFNHMSQLQLGSGEDFFPKEYDLNEMIMILFGHVSKSVGYKYTNLCENISNVMSSFFLAELLAIIVSLASGSSKINGGAMELLKDLVRMASTRGNRMGYFEIEQLQLFTIWTLLHFDYYKLESKASNQGKIFNIARLQDVRVPTEEDVSKLRRLLNNCKNQLKIRDFSLTPIDRTALFPLTTELSAPVRHHPWRPAVGGAQPQAAAESEIVPENESSYTNVLTDLQNQVASLMQAMSLDETEEQDEVFEYVH